MCVSAQKQGGRICQRPTEAPYSQRQKEMHMGHSTRLVGKAWLCPVHPLAGAVWGATLPATSTE